MYIVKVLKCNKIDFYFPVIDCVMSEWESWSECDTECGSGMMTRKRQVMKTPVNGGKHCPSLVQKRACMGTRCPNYPGSALKGINISHFFSEHLKHSETYKIYIYL